MVAPTTPKATYYANQLLSALAAGQWTHSSPAKAYNSDPISWSELARKSRKYLSKSEDEELPDVLANTHALSLLLLRSTNDPDGNSDFDRRAPFELSHQLLLKEERLKEAEELYNNILKESFGAKGKEKEQVPARTSHLLAYFSYALHRPHECLDYLNNLDSPLVDGLSELPKTAKTPDPKTALLSVPSASPYLATPKSASPNLARSNTATSSHFSLSIHMHHYHQQAADSQARIGEIWSHTERIRGFCLQGMCYERLSPDDLSLAVQSYSAAFPLISTIIAIVRPNQNRFLQYKEFYRWAETLLYRSIVLSAKSQHNILEVVELYQSLLLPNTTPVFRPHQRHFVYSLHLMSLHSSPSGEFKAIASAHQQLLELTTQLPRAGERNTKVEWFVEACVQFFEQRPLNTEEEASWVLDVIYWSLSLTFSAPPILRQLTRLLYATSQYDLARRSLRVYVEIVSKARQSKDEVHQEKTALEWVGMLIWGSRMLCRLEVLKVEDGKGMGRGGVRTALSYLEKAHVALAEDERTPQDQKNVFEAAIKLAEGIAYLVLPSKEEDPSTRIDHFVRAHTLFTSAISIISAEIPQHKMLLSQIHFHLSISHSLPQTPHHSITEAIFHAQKSVEINPEDEMRGWHLLGLLLTARGDWKAGRVVCKRGIELGDATLAGTARRERVRDFAYEGQGASAPHPSTELRVNTSPSYSSTLIPSDTKTLPPAFSSSSLELLAPPASSRQDRFCQVLQLRLTELAIIEHSEGAEEASNAWVEVFSWFGHGKEGLEDDTRRLSEDTTMEAPPSPMTATDEAEGMQRLEAQLKEGNEDHRVPSTINGSSSGDIDQENVESPLSESVPSMPASIQITPATPLDDDEKKLSHSHHSLGHSHSSQSHVETQPTPRSSSIMTNTTADTSTPPAPPLPQPKRQGSKDGDHHRKKVQQVQQLLKSQVSKGREGIKTVQKKISRKSSGVIRRDRRVRLYRSNSEPDFHAVLAQTKPYQASSIHSRQRRIPSFGIHRSTAHEERGGNRSDGRSSPPATVTPPTTLTVPNTPTPNDTRPAWERRLLSDLWASAAASFRRAGEDKADEVLKAIQEAEVADAGNVNVWVQYGLYLLTTHPPQPTLAIESFNKALFVDPESIPAIIQLCAHSLSVPSPTPDKIDMAVGLLTKASLYNGWDVPEVWYFLAKACRMQGRMVRERQCLETALTLVEGRGVREIKEALGLCL